MKNRYESLLAGPAVVALALGCIALNPAQLHAADSTIPLEKSSMDPIAEPITEEAVTKAIQEYVFAKYAGDVDAVRSRTHHDIARRTVMDTYWGAPSTEWVRIYSHDHLQFYGTSLNQTKLDSPTEGRCEIEVFDIEQFTAAARVIMEDVVDYLHLVHFDGKWLIADSAVIILDEQGARAPGKSIKDKDTIESIVRDYCIGFYEIDGEKVQDTCHPSLSKRTVEKPDNVDFDFFKLITWEEINVLGETFNTHWGFDPETARCDVEVYEIRDN
ncbi:MAG: nuclear transport factor 2 family protein, partial [Phycisphaerales bacterium]|nr:nuclear transport factor 2 family protein [Phycisphaerales bacterium]